MLTNTRQNGLRTYVYQLDIWERIQTEVGQRGGRDHSIHVCGNNVYVAYYAFLGIPIAFSSDPSPLPVVRNGSGSGGGVVAVTS